MLLFSNQRIAYLRILKVLGAKTVQSSTFVGMHTLREVNCLVKTSRIVEQLPKSSKNTIAVVVIFGYCRTIFFHFKDRSERYVFNVLKSFNGNSNLYQDELLGLYVTLHYLVHVTDYGVI